MEHYLGLFHNFIFLKFLSEIQGLEDQDLLNFCILASFAICYLHK